MSTDTKHTVAIISTIIGTGVAVAGFLATSLGARITNVENELRAVRSELREEIRTPRNELRDEIRALDGRVRTVETGFARVDQRLDTVERAVIPSAEPPQ